MDGFDKDKAEHLSEHYAKSSRLNLSQELAKKDDDVTVEEMYEAIEEAEDKCMDILPDIVPEIMDDTVRVHIHHMIIKGLEKEEE